MAASDPKQSFNSESLLSNVRRERSGRPLELKYLRALGASANSGMLVPIRNTLTTMAHTQIAPGKRRIDFGLVTRQLLHAAAGQRCCFRTCLRLTSGVSRKHGDDCERGVGVAAHVYSAAQQGPRGRGGLTPEQVRSASNGLWMCSLHGREVDDFQDEYPAEDLLRMKAVRELAHKLERSDDNVAFYVKVVGLEAWNECVWEHVAATSVTQIPAVDPGVMIKAFKSTAIQRLAVIELYNTTLQSKLPAQFAVKPAAAAAAALVRPVAQTAGTFLLGMNDTPERTIRFARERARAIDIITALGDLRWPDPSGSHAFIVDGAVLLTAADPVTGTWYDGGVWQMATLVGSLRYSVEGGEEVCLSVRSTFDPVSAFIWTFRVELKSSVCRLDNVLRKQPLSIPYLRYPVGRIEFGNYRDLLAKIAAGWKPLAFVSLLRYEHGLEDHTSLYAQPFEPDLVISESELVELERDCDKVTAALDVATRWAEYWGSVGSPPTDFNFNGLFFAEYIDRDLVWYAYDALIAACLINRTDPLRWRTEPLVMTSRRTGIVFRFRRGALAFENILIRTDLI